MSSTTCILASATPGERRLASISDLSSPPPRSGPGRQRPAPRRHLAPHRHRGPRHRKPAPQRHRHRGVNGTNHRPENVTGRHRLNALTMEVARHLQTFEQAVAVEQAELRGRMIHQSLEAAGLRARIQVLESKLVPAASSERHRGTRRGASRRTPSRPPRQPSPRRPPHPSPRRQTSRPPNPSRRRPSRPSAPANGRECRPGDPSTHGDVVDAKIAACAVQVSNMIIESHTRVQASLTETALSQRAYDEELLNLARVVTRLEGIVEKSDGQRLDVTRRRRKIRGPASSIDQGLLVVPPSESRLE
jgi:hypothetical protein